MRISDWSSDVCSSDLDRRGAVGAERADRPAEIHPGRRDDAAGAADDAAARSLRHSGTADFLYPCRAGTGDRPRGAAAGPGHRPRWGAGDREAVARDTRSEEHTSELQSLMRNSYAVF